MTTPTLSARQLEILQHALGLDQYGQGQMYRNHFCAGEDDEDVCRELVALGLMRNFDREWLPYYNCIVTEEGKAATLAQSPKPPKLTPGQIRYRNWLKADLDISFIEYLKLTSKRGPGPHLAPGQSLEDFCDAYQKANW